MKKNRTIFDQIKILSSEQRNNKSHNFDTMRTNKILTVINDEDGFVISAVKKEIPYISKAIALVIDSLKTGGRLIYVGAGTSGRLGVLDASECPPTFGTNPSMVQGIIAGGKKAIFNSQEGAEDDTVAALKDIRSKKIQEKDVVCGIAASLRTPYVMKAVIEAKREGAKTIYITTNPRSILNKKEFKTLRDCLDVAICPEVGPEVIMGSTRMKSGTAQKLVLNMITTTSMIQLGKVYENMMVDLKMNSKKLEERAKRVLMISTGVDYQTASNVLKKAGGHVKTAIVMIKTNSSVTQARAHLRKANGFVRIAIQEKRK
jgi:N-acetylmuramic acid 6-phosphate etherase